MPSFQILIDKGWAVGYNARRLLALTRDDHAEGVGGEEKDEDTGNTDMRTGAYAPGGIETVILVMGCAQTARLHGVPSAGFAGLTNAKVDNAQAGYETGLSTMGAMMGGVDLLPEIADRRPRAQWLADGGRDAQARALDKAREILGRDNPAILAPDVDAAIRSRFQIDF